MESGKVIKSSTERAAKWNASKARLYSLQYAGARQSTDRIIEFLKTHSPDVVHLQNLNGYFVDIYRLLAYLEAVKQPTVLTLHAEFMFTGGCGHALDCNRWLNVPGCGSCPQLREATKSIFLDRTRTGWLRMKSAFEGDTSHIAVASVSPWLRSRAEASPILSGLQHHTVFNGLDVEVFRPHPLEAENVTNRAARDLARPLTLLHVTPYFTDTTASWKGGGDVLELARRLGDRVVINVVGKLANHTTGPPNVRFLGRIDAPDMLAKHYTMADAVLLTSRRETFSMVTAESLACGTPVIGYQAGAPEQIALASASCFVRQGDIDALVSSCETELAPQGRLATLDRTAVSLEARSLYSVERMVTNYLGIYESVIARAKGSG